MTRPAPRPVVTFDLFSALIDSRSGGSAALAGTAGRERWPVAGAELYDRWDAANKAAQKACRGWRPHAELARESLGAVLAEIGVHAGAADLDRYLGDLLGSVPRWPLWDDVTDGLRALAGQYRLGLLSNVDDALFRSTRAAPLVDHEVALTSERLGVYKPDPLIYRRAAAALGPVVHVASSPRDVRGALEAGIPVVRLVRPGHAVDPQGPRPPVEVGSVAELEAVLPRLLGASG